ncbi:anthranilate synthetase [Eremomyces bilateralis CBS 781.70]|uniref:anthranilate synthase n=1 Tax=Eremomyces bilateralis CBS 781.70 TaxID=1392243 RepID=A0A6G1GCJ1_9PEZI|nr:anthranilate synthetase [Eremomyces bilateralis CBS 781.70]KAF1815569.1 anthranilate synthetase [Eremomyces bilateralis CBS 781.70]
MSLSIQPSLATVRDVLSAAERQENPPNLIPLSATLSAEFLTPSLIYLKLAARAKTKSSFLFESAMTTQTIGRWSFVGVDPRKVLRSGPGQPVGPRDPLPVLEEELSRYRVASVPGVQLPPLIGGAIGYVGYDCVAYFEPRTARDDMKDVLEVPESLFMLFDTVVAVDHFYQLVKVFTYVKVPKDSKDSGALESAYEAAEKELRDVVHTITQTEVPLPPQGPIELEQEYTSNIGQAGYEAHVTRLKEHIHKGDIIQAVPSQRIARPTSLHPFNIYRRLRMVNPSPYLFFVDCEDFQIVGASPEVLVKSEEGRIITHPIAGTVKRGKTVKEDDELAQELSNSLKDRAEHVMLVDLARNDVNRVCDPLSTRVDRLMIIQRFSHVQHITSEVSGVLRPGMTRFDAFRSIFPAGTVSGAPKVRAMELIAELEGEKRGVYAGAVGYFGYNTVDANGTIEEGSMDTCIALRTMVVKDGVAYLQAGGGIVFDSDNYDEFVETLNKLKANVTCIDSAELVFSEQAAQTGL